VYWSQRDVALVVPNAFLWQRQYRKAQVCFRINLPIAQYAPSSLKTVPLWSQLCKLSRSLAMYKPKTFVAMHFQPPNGLLPLFLSVLRRLPCFVDCTRSFLLARYFILEFVCAHTLFLVHISRCFLLAPQWTCDTW